jgi:hypothetical protein
MKTRTRTPCLSLFVALLLTSFASAVAQGLKNVIPTNQSSIPKIFPPSVAAQTPSGTGKFVIFTREEVGREGEWDFIAGAWECIPSRPDVPVTKRVEFCHSSWNASPLLDGLVRDDSCGRFPRFVRLQVNAGDRDYRVNLYDINYRTWDVRRIWQGERLGGFGVMQGTVFCEDDEDWFRLDSATGTIRKGVPFIPLDVNGPYWIVRKLKEEDSEWSYDPVKEKFVARFAAVEMQDAGDYESLVSPDGRSRAWVLIPFPKSWLPEWLPFPKKWLPASANWQGGVVEGTLLLQRDKQSVDIRVPVKVQAVAGSGRPIIPFGTGLKFTLNGKLEFSATTDQTGTNARVWTIEIASGKVTRSSRWHNAPPPPDFAVFDGVPTPEYLRPYLHDFTHYGRSGLSPAFLIHLGILKQPPEYPDCAAGVSPDGRHILFRAKNGPLSDVFIYGDLQTKTTVRWKSPEGIKPTDSMDFVWVETP